jgi:pimeloyl-ACP methyl ester carboxylesterase
MVAWFLGLLAALPASAENKVETIFVKVGPTPLTAGRSADRDKAVVLVHGLGLHPFSSDKALRAKLRAWQQGDSPIVKKLGEQADVYALAYGQNAAIDKIADDPSLVRYLVRVKKEGYKEIILVGHSAGGLIVRQLVEDHPDLGVTRVVQICAPNSGSALASLKAATAAQMEFMVSLTRAFRLKALEKRDAKKIPASVEFVCVVAAARLPGDGVVVAKSQWPLELQAQGIPAVSLRATHWDVMKNPKTVELLHKLVKESQPRWDAKKVLESLKSIAP